MKNNFIKTEGYPKWIYINKLCREGDKRIAIGEIPNSENRFIFYHMGFCGKIFIQRNYF